MEKDEILKLREKLIEIYQTDKVKADSIVHALVDIEESLNNIYHKIIPQLFENSLKTTEIQDLLWDIREDFRHVDYHIHDADLINL